MAGNEKNVAPKGRRGRNMPARVNGRFVKQPVATEALPEPAAEPIAEVVAAVADPTPEWPVPVAEAVVDAAPPAAEIKPSAKTMTKQDRVSSVAIPAPAALKKGPEIMTDVIETSKAFAEDAKARIQSAVAELNEKTKTAMEKSSKAMEEMTEITKGNLEALVESSKIAAKGVETMGQDAAEYGRKSFEKTSATIKSFAAVKSPTEFFQLQSELMTSTFDTMAAEAAKTSEAMLKLAGEIAQPISNRVAVVSDKFKSLAA